MLYRIALVLSPFFIAAGALAAPQTPPPLHGTWSGGFQSPRGFIPIELIVRKAGAGYRATMHLPEKSVKVPASLKREGDRVSWSVSTGPKLRLKFEGEQEAEFLHGRMSGPAVADEVDCAFVRVTPIDVRTRQRLIGFYRVDDKQPVRVREIERKGTKLMRLDCEARRVHGVLYPVGGNAFVITKDRVPRPTTARVLVRTSATGKVESLEITSGGQAFVARPAKAPRTTATALPPMPGKPLAPGLEIVRRTATIDADDVKLAGTLYLPPGTKRPCAAVVQLHGSGRTQRRQQFFLTSMLLRCGVAVLAYDKRGCGASTGTFRGFSVSNSARLFDVLSGDAAAAHKWLRKQPEIDPERVGLWGGSQAGWIMPLVPEKTEGVRFIISGCGPTVSAGEEHQHSLLLNRGLTVDEADRKLADYKGPLGYDPRPVLRRTRVPTLWLFGKRDDIIPTRACIQEFQKLVAEGHTHHEAHVFEDADHDYATSNQERVLLEPVIGWWLRKIGVLR